MNWINAIEINRIALLRVVTGLFAAVGMVAGQPLKLSRFIRGSVLHTLRPAESAMRRLALIFEQRVGVETPVLRPVRARTNAPVVPNAANASEHAVSERVPVFVLFDPRKRFDLGEPKKPRHLKYPPRITVFGVNDWVARPAVKQKEPLPKGPEAVIDATRLRRRMEALIAALNDVPGQAKRLARMRARRAMGRHRIRTPMRGGWPPGHRQRGRYEIDTLLRNCHGLALWAQEPHDTS